MIHNIKRYLLTLVALLAMTTGAWAQTVTVTWTLADLQANPDVTTFTKDGVTLKCDTRMSSGKSFVGPVTFSTTLGNFTKIEITGTSSAPITADEFTNDDKVSTWTGNAASISTPASIAYATQFVFTIAPAGPVVTLDDTKTVATMAAMPAYDATVSYQLVRDLTVQTQFYGVPTETVFVKKDGDKFVFASGTAPTVALLDMLNQNTPITDGAAYYFEKKNAETGDFEASTVNLLTDAQPGTWRIVTTAVADGPYDGTVRSDAFTLAEAYDLTLSPATDAHLQSVTVAGTAKTADENGVIRGIEPTKKVKITTTGPDYIIRKAAVKKGGASGVLTGVINLDNLKEGDIMKDITGFTGNYVCITLKEGRYKYAGSTSDIPKSLEITRITFNANGYTLTDDMDYNPVDENGQDGNAWIFLGIQSGDPVFGGYTLK